MFCPLEDSGWTTSSRQSWRTDGAGCGDHDIQEESQLYGHAAMYEALSGGFHNPGQHL